MTELHRRERVCVNQGESRQLNINEATSDQSGYHEVAAARKNK